MPELTAGALRRNWPLVLALVMSALLLAVPLAGLVSAFNGALEVPFLCGLFLLSYVLGTRTGLGAGLAVTVLLAASVNIASQGFSPVSLMITVGPWLAGPCCPSAG